MNDSPEPKPTVDSLRTAGIARAEAVGGGQGFFTRPKRKRGFHRAVKSGKAWALMEKGMRDCWAKLVQNIVVDPNIPANMMIGLGAYLDSTPEDGDKD